MSNVRCGPIDEEEYEKWVAEGNPEKMWAELKKKLNILVRIGSVKCPDKMMKLIECCKKQIDIIVDNVGGELLSFHLVTAVGPVGRYINVWETRGGNLLAFLHYKSPFDGRPYVSVIDINNEDTVIKDGDVLLSKR